MKVASLNGTVQAVTVSSAVISVGGVGFSVSTTPDTLSRIHTVK